ncbi:MAG: S8 family serine peptidase, partial [bacterium]|nr:S8 family serine peptidase [bacterium]
EIEYVARNVPPAVPGETFDVIHDGAFRSCDLSVFYRVHFDEALELDVVLADLETVACVDSAAYWPVAVLHDVDPPDDSYGGPYHDQLSDEQWYLRAPDSANPGGIDIEGAWRCMWEDLTADPQPEVVVAVIDGSFGTQLHVDLHENAHPESRIEWDTVPWRPHGSWVSGVVSAAAGNRHEREVLTATADPNTVGIGITGLAPMLKAIYTGHPNPFSSIRVLEQCAYLIYDIDTEIDVINMSWGFERENATLRALTEVAYYDRGIVLVASAGNINEITGFYDAYPAVYDHVIAVGANTEHGQRAIFSNYGPNRVDLLAPGAEIITTGFKMPKPRIPIEEVDENDWATVSGTSLSAPM